MSTSKAKSATKKLGRVMYTHNHYPLKEQLVSAYGGNILKGLPLANNPVLLIPLSDPAALVEAMHQEYINSGWCGSRQLIENIAKRLGVPAKLLKERKKK